MMKKLMFIVEVFIAITLGVAIMYSWGAWSIFILSSAFIANTLLIVLKSDNKPQSKDNDGGGVL